MRALIITNFITKARARIAAMIASALLFAGSASATMNISNITTTINDLGAILSALVGLLQIVIVNNIDVFVVIIILMVLLYIIKRFGWSFADFFEGILGGLFREDRRQ